MTNLNLDQFLSSLKNASPPTGLTRALSGLWYDGHGDWDAAHRKIQTGNGANEDWVHAYLHRKEGDLANAAYWYSRSGHSLSTKSLDDEWFEIVTMLLSKNANATAS